MSSAGRGCKRVGSSPARRKRDQNRAPLAAVLRIDGDLIEVVARLDQLAERAEAADTGNAVEIAALRGRVRQLENRGQV